MTPNKNEGLIAWLNSRADHYARRAEIMAKYADNIDNSDPYAKVADADADNEHVIAARQREAARAIQDLEEEVGRLRSALQQIAQPPYGLGFNRLRGLARKALASTADGG